MKAIVVTDQAQEGWMKLAERPEPQGAGSPASRRRTTAMSSFKFMRRIHWDDLSWPSTWIDRLGRDRTPSIPGHEVGRSGPPASAMERPGCRWDSGCSASRTGLATARGLSMWPSRARNLAPLPGDVDFTVGAGLVMPGLTAWQGLFEHGRLRAGQSILVHGAAGVVGSM